MFNPFKKNPAVPQQSPLASESRASYSQCGEDMIVAFLLDALGIKCPTYVDAGTHDPIKLNNTYHFYERGFSGICIEPNPECCKSIAAARPRDHVVNVGIGMGAESINDFYVLQPSTLSTFNKKDAEELNQANRAKIERVVRIRMQHLWDVISGLTDKVPDYVSLDVEGLNAEIVASLDFTRIRPTVLCLETLDFTSGQKIQPIFTTMSRAGYIIYADTYINTVFVEAATWKRSASEWMGMQSEI